MADATALAATVKAALTSDDFKFYDGYVPAKVPEAGGYILPYVVLWAGDGEPADQQAACGLQGTSSLLWDFQTTCVASSPEACRAVARDVRAALTNLPAGTGRIKPNPDGFQQNVPVLDPTATPARFMLPVPWRITTN
ncbi:hypothetical protein [Zhihengliuella flava]|uniref:Uncharacterized protein n=1 Tax=Zhihengliuella flava TaxID=1285193 RepID=A0A931DFB9_9MICC|nr:hypothetical protein [Zhihengliuella flava]MBG6085815.1 hypothetical protein [Zhihengliuella flava]